MKENRELHIDEVLTELYQLREENQSLKIDNDFLQRQNNGLRLKLQSITSMSMFEFANAYCNDAQLEEAGHAFARSLLGHQMTDEEIAIEQAENCYVPYNGDDF